MRHKFRSNLTYANVMATIAVFIALGGAATFAATSVCTGGLPCVNSDDIINGEVKTPDLGTSAVTAAKIGTSAVTNSKIATSAVASGKIAPSAVTSGKVLDNTLTGADINESTLGTVPNANSAGRAASVESSCDPASTSFTACGTVTLTLPTSSRVMVVANGQWYSVTTSGPTKGQCRVLVDGPPGTGTVLGNAAFPGETVDTSDSTHEKTVALTAVTSALAAGSHTFSLHCTQDEGNIAMDETSISAASFSAA